RCIGGMDANASRRTHLMQSKRRNLTGLALSLAMLLAGVAGARAQQPATPGGGGAETKINLDLRDVPFRTAIDALFWPAGLQFAIQPETANVPITVTLREVEFSTALRTILRLANATYRKETSIYVIGPRVQQQEQTQPTAEFAPAEPTPANKAAGETWDKI